MPKRSRFVFVFLLLSLIFISSVGAEYWPGNEWRKSTPEEQGMDSERLYRMMKMIIDNKYDIHSVLVIRHGHIVLEAYFPPYRQDVQQNINRCYESFNSALVGIALKEGKIKSIEQKIIDFFPEAPITSQMERKKNISIKHALTMSTALDWGHHSGAFTHVSNQMLHSADWVEFILNRPMTVFKSGETFQYNKYIDGISYIISPIITKSTGESPLTYANEKLFNPLGIKDVKGYISREMGTVLKLTPRDMAKFGYLYLNNGNWKGKQIIPDQWVKASTKSQIRTRQPYENASGYGYLWWINDFGYMAKGWGGQYIMVAPELDLVVVFTAGLRIRFNLHESTSIEKYSNNDAIPLTLTDLFITGSVKGNEPLPVNKEANFRLNKLIKEIEKPKPQPVPALPEIAWKISGRGFQLGNNRFGFDSFTLTFNKETSNKCRAKLKMGDYSLDLPVGLDAMYKIDPKGGACRGRWDGKDSFILELHSFESGDKLTFTFKFIDNGKRVEVDAESVIFDMNQSIQGRVE